MENLPTITTTEKIIDRVPINLPVTCLRKTDTGFWRLKTATELGVKQTDFRDLDDLEAIERALMTYRSIHPLAAGPIVLCLDGEEYFGLEPILGRVFTQGHIKKGISELTFPWSTKPKH